MIGTFDQATTRRLVVAVPLGAYRFGIAVTSNHPLAHHSRLALNDLAGQHLLMVPRGISEKNDQLRDAIETAAPDVIIEGTRGRYNLDVFNRAADQNLALLNLTPTWSRAARHAAHRQLRGLGLAPGSPASPGFHESVEAVNLKGSATQPLGWPWAKARAGVSAERTVLRPYLGTRPAVGEHVICTTVKK